MKDIIIVILILTVGLLAGIFVQRKYPEKTQRFIPELSDHVQRIYPLLEAGPSGVQENGYILIFHEGGGVTWEKPIAVGWHVGSDE